MFPSPKPGGLRSPFPMSPGASPLSNRQASPWQSPRPPFMGQNIPNGMAPHNIFMSPASIQSNGSGPHTPTLRRQSMNSSGKPSLSGHGPVRPAAAAEGNGQGQYGRQSLGSGGGWPSFSGAQQNNLMAAGSTTPLSGGGWSRAYPANRGSGQSGTYGNPCSVGSSAGSGSWHNQSRGRRGPRESPYKSSISSPLHARSLGRKAGPKELAKLPVERYFKHDMLDDPWERLMFLRK